MNIEELTNTLSYLVKEKSQLDKTSDDFKIMSQQMLEVTQLIIDSQRQYLLVSDYYS